MITSVVKQWRHPQYTNFHNLQNLLKRIRQCCFLSGLLMVRSCQIDYYYFPIEYKLMFLSFSAIIINVQLHFIGITLSDCDIYIWIAR